ncbi:MAG: transporter, partial [Rickettsiales bacterium]|nr:transporter [Rickettsiales bacterium]
MTRFFLLAGTALLSSLSIASLAQAEPVKVADNSSAAADVLEESLARSAQEASSQDLPDLKTLMRMVKEQQTRLDQQEKELRLQKARLQFFQSQLSQANQGSSAAQNTAAAPANTPVKTIAAINPAAGSGTPATQTAEANQTPPKNPDAVGIDRKPKDRERPPTVDAVRNEGGVLLTPGKLVIEPSLEYNRSSALRVSIEGFTIIPALNVGAFEITEVDRDSLTAAMAARLGITERFELEARVPYVYRDDATLSRPIGTGSDANVLSNVSGYGIGDVEMAGHYQITDGKGNWPFLVGNLRFKSRTGTDPFEVPIDASTGLQSELPTGSGFYALQPSLTAILPSDPIVLYGNVGYLYNMPRDFGGTIGEIDPGDSVSMALGMGFAANERTSFSIGYSHSMVFETTQNGQAISNSDVLQVGSLGFGVGYKVNDWTSVNVSVDAGLTDDAPDMRLLFRVPMTFNLY